MSLQYLEDFLEYAEELPQIFCDRLTKVRELDLEVRNREDHARKLKGSLHQLRRDSGLPVMPRTQAISKISDEINDQFNRIVHLSGEKIKIVASLEQMMCRFNERLHEETEKFKLEIEADSPGCTARLEERAKEEMFPLTKSPPVLPFSLPPHSRPGGRRPFGQDPSNRLLLPGADIAAFNTLVCSDNISEMRLSAHGTLVENCGNDATNQTLVPSRNDKCRFSAAPVKPNLRNIDAFLFPSETAPLEEEEDDTKKYCFCEGLGGGLMVACDNADCLQEWFHGDCVGIKCEADISGKMWYCPSCSERLEKVASLHQDLGLRPRGPRLNAGRNSVKDRRSR